MPNTLHFPINKLIKLLINFALLSFILLFCAIALEIAASYLIKNFDHPLYDVRKDKIISFYPYKSVRYKSNEFDFTLSTNQYGRRDINWSDNMIRNPSNLIFIGDSFVMGYGVDIKDTIPYLLTKLSSDNGQSKYVFNFGMPGNIGIPEYKKLLLESLSLNIQAKTILIGIFIGNDFSPNPNPSTHQSIKNDRQFSLMQSNLLRLIKYEVGSYPRLVAYLLNIGNQLGINLYRSPTNALFLRNQTKDQKNFSSAQLKILLAIKDLCTKNNRSLFIIIFPNKIQVENARELDSVIYQADKPNKMILEFCNSHNLQCFDLLPFLRDNYLISSKALYYPADRHLNALGNLVAARAIYNYLNKYDVERPGQHN